MRILSTALDMRAWHQSVSITHQQQQERVTPLAARADRASLGAAVRPEAAPPPVAQPASPPETAEATQGDDDLRNWLQSVEARYQVLVRLLERMTGQPIQMLTAEDVASGGRGTEAAPGHAASSGAAGPQDGGEGPVLVERSAISMHMEYEAVAFQAQGRVQTADGRAISFELSFQLERSFFEVTATSSREVRERLKDPLVISLNGTSASVGDARFDFDLDADGRVESIAGLKARQGFLALDRNGDGRINDGRELFGAQSGNGFADLAAFDQDGNRWIDEGDAVFARLALWLDAGSSGGRLVSLKNLGIGAISLDAAATTFDQKSMDQTLLARLRQSGV